MKRHLLTRFGSALAILCLAQLSFAETYYVSPAGDDRNDGSLAQPFRTVRHAVSVVQGGDEIYLRGGIYYLDQTVRIERASGTPTQPTKLWAYPDEEPVLDGSRFTVLDKDAGDNDIIRLRAAYWHLKGLTLRNSSAGGMLLTGDESVGNILEQLTIHDNRDTGLDLYDGVSQTLILNCDSYRNFDPQTNGENADGFGAKSNSTDTFIGLGNVFRGCRAWANSDDGWDFWKAGNAVTVENCWAYNNGFDIWDFGSSFTGNGNGFKLGREEGAHVLKNCLAWGNRVRGFDVNNNMTGVTLYNCTGWNNDRNFVFYGPNQHVLRNCLSVEGDVDISGNTDDAFNSWTLPNTTNEVGVRSVSDQIATGPRPPDGSLPVSDFLRLTADSYLIDQGVDVGLPFSGAAPDLGAYEYAAEPTSASNGVGRTEAEAMDLNGYEVAGRDGASGGQVAQVVSLGQGGSVSYRFTGEDGEYDLAIRYLDEIDGSSTFTLITNGVTTRQWGADQVTEGNDQWKIQTVSGVFLRQNSRIEIQAGANRGEYARLDYVEVTPVAASNNAAKTTETKVDTRTYPSIFQAWNPIDNLDEDQESLIARHDLLWHGPQFFKLAFNNEYRGLADGVTSASVEQGLAYRNSLLEKNENLVMLAEIRYRDAPENYLPSTDHPWWLRDDNGNLVYGWEEGGYIRLDINNPDFQDKVAAGAEAIVKSGVVDGIMLDWWTENEFLEGRIALLRKIRAAIGEDALIIVNANDRQVPQSAPYINGMFMEVGSSQDAADWNTYLENLRWGEANLRKPRINCLETWYANSRDDLNLMRATTTLSMTVADGYALFADPNLLPVPDHLHNWYNFWDADLGTPVDSGYRRTDGAYERKFTNGTAVYNPPGNQEITVSFATPVKSTSTGRLQKVHTIDALDGDIFIEQDLAPNEEEALTIHARGTTGEENMALRIDGQTVQTWTVTTDWAEYVYDGKVSGTVQVAFTNDAMVRGEFDRNLVVDRVTVAGQVLQAEDQENNTGAWDGRCGAGSFSEWLQCNGYIDFGDVDRNARPSDLAKQGHSSPTDVLATGNRLTVYPNPVADGPVRVAIEGDVSSHGQLRLTDARGRLVLQQATYGVSHVDLDVESLPDGVYLLRMIGPQRMLTKKLVVR